MLRNTLQSIKRTTIRTVVGGSVTLAVVEYTTHLPSQGRSSELYHAVSDKIVTPLMRTYLDPEVAHNVALEFARRGLALRHRPSAVEQGLNVSSTLTYGGTDSESNDTTSPKQKLVFPNPIGLAAGFDKDGTAIQPLLEMGFGSVEIGTVTPQPQEGNAKPRMFRLVDDLGIINRYGFNSQGADAVEQNVQQFRQAQQQQLTKKKQDSNPIQSFYNYVFPPVVPAKGLLGINIGKNKTTEDAKVDYVANIQQLAPYADYIVINISSPNTPNLRDLQQSKELSELVDACLEARNALPRRVPLLVKIAPDLTSDQLKSMVPTLHKVDGVVVTNTTNERPPDLVASVALREESGGLSGAPLKHKSTELIRELYQEMEGNVFIVGVGGIGSGQDAYEKLKAGASVVQIYSMMVYQGPGSVSRIRHELASIMKDNGYSSLDDVIGRDHEQLFWKRRQQQQAQQLVADANDETTIRAE